jgi:hypothetical protein
MSKTTVHGAQLVIMLGLSAFVSACGSAPSIAPGGSIADHAVTSNARDNVARSSSPLLYVSDTNAYTFHIYPANENNPNPPPIQVIGNGDDKPLGICVDRAGTLYSVNRGFTFERFSFVAVYPAGAGSPTTIVKDGLRSPMSCAVDKSGTLFVSNNEAAPDGTPLVVIEEYASGSLSPTGSLTITDPQKIGNPGGCAGGMTFDSAGDLFVAADFYSQANLYARGHVYEFASGATKARDLNLTGIASTCESGVGVDGIGNLFVGSVKRTGTAGIAVFGPGQTTPSRRITKGLTSPVLFSVDSAGSLYVPNYAPPQQPQRANIVEFAPGGSVPVNTIASSDYVSPFGIALTPSF